MKNILIFIVLTLGVYSHSSAQCNNADDYTALRALYLNTDGDNWTDNSGWPDAATFMANPTIPAGTEMCDWYGIYFSTASVVVNSDVFNESLRIRFVNLKENNLVESLPSEIGLMVSLSILNLRDNSINGNISSLSTLINLSGLHLSGTNVSGDISALNKFTPLRDLYLSDTDIHGDIGSLYPLTNLEYVHLENTSVEGDIAVFERHDIFELFLNNTNVSGDLSSLQNTPCYVLRVSNTNVTGDLSYLSFRNLISLHVKNLNLPGCWSSYFKSKCGSPQNFDFDGNQGVISNQGFMDFCNNDVGQCPNSCPDFRTRTCSVRAGCELVGGTYQALDSVKYSGRHYISPGVGVALGGSKGVELSDGFEVKKGGILYLDAEGCTQN